MRAIGFRSPTPLTSRLQDRISASKCDLSTLPPDGFAFQQFDGSDREPVCSAGPDRILSECFVFADQPATVQQNRTLTNFGVKSDLAYVKGRHNAKGGIQISQTNLLEDFHLGVTDPTFNPVCLTSTGAPVLDPTITDPAACVADGYQPNPNLAVGLIAFDLTRGGTLFHFHQGAHIKEQAAYVEDAITVKQFISEPWWAL